jgi:hypothetical protein
MATVNYNYLVSENQMRAITHLNRIIKNNVQAVLLRVYKVLINGAWKF